MTAARDCSLHCTSLPGLANLPPYSVACNKRTEFPAPGTSPSEHTLHLIPAFLHILSAIFYFPSPKSDQFQSCTGHGRVPRGSAKAVMLSLDSKQGVGARGCWAGTGQVESGAPVPVLSTLEKGGLEWLLGV